MVSLLLRENLNETILYIKLVKKEREVKETDKDRVVIKLKKDDFENHMIITDELCEKAIDWFFKEDDS